MSRLGFAFSMVLIVLSAAWAYHVNYRTVEALEETERLRARIAEEREAVQVLRIEWAYLNAPDRLAALVVRVNDRLGLGPMDGRQYGTVSEVPYRPEPAPLPAPGASPLPGFDAGDELGPQIGFGGADAPALGDARPVIWSEE